MFNRRSFLKTGLLGTAAFIPRVVPAGPVPSTEILRPPALRKNDVIGLITPSSPLFEGYRTLTEAEEKIHALGFRTRPGKHIFKKNGYLAGTVEERLEDIHSMFEDADVSAIMAIRGGYGSGQLLPYMDYDLIKRNPKILVGYSDITALHLGIHRMTGLVTFHGPVAVSTFTGFTTKYFLDVLTKPQALGDIEDAPFEENLQTTNRVWTVLPGVAEGRLTGGNLTLMAATLGTPYEIDTRDRIIFIEEVGEEPYDLDRLLNHLKQAGKFETCKGVFFDSLKDIKPSSYRPAFDSSLSVEEVILNTFKEYRFPLCVGLSIGHIKDKPTLPLGISVRLDADAGRLSILEPAVR